MDANSDYSAESAGDFVVLLLLLLFNTDSQASSLLTESGCQRIQNQIVFMNEVPKYTLNFMR